MNARVDTISSRPPSARAFSKFSFAVCISHSIAAWPLVYSDRRGPRGTQNGIGVRFARGSVRVVPSPPSLARMFCRMFKPLSRVSRENTGITGRIFLSRQFSYFSAFSLKVNGSGCLTSRAIARGVRIVLNFLILLRGDHMYSGETEVIKTPSRSKSVLLRPYVREWFFFIVATF